MGYAAAKGGLDAILAAEALVRTKRMGAPSPWLGTDEIVDRLRLAVDRVMGEGGLWDPELAAVALRQAEGDLIEASHLLRAYRSTLPRLAYSEPVDADELTVLRRIVPAYRNPPGPQLLGRTTDYSGRLIELLPEVDARAEGEKLAAVSATAPSTNGSRRAEPTTTSATPTRLYELLREKDLVVDRRHGDDPTPFDVTRTPPRPPAPRSARLAAMARAETGALVNLWYRNILGPDGYIHEVTLGEVRHGHLPVRVAHPRTGNPVSIGRVRATEVEAIEDLDGPDEDRGRFDVGYGMVFGHNERKAIAMASLDVSCHRDDGRSSLEQSLLLTTDGLDSSGFLEHLKLPHYVTFRSMVERKEAVRRANQSDASDTDDIGDVNDDQVGEPDRLDAPAPPARPLENARP
ncbi:carbon-phosphorus lyase complex subunit PhnI [soil metagenome]